MTARRGESLAAAASSEIAEEARGVSGRVGKSDAVGPGTLLWSEAANAGWHATANGHELEQSKAFDWTNAFALNERSPVGLHFRAGALPGLLVELEIVAWIVAVVAWRRTRSRPARGRNRGVDA